MIIKDKNGVDMLINKNTIVKAVEKPNGAGIIIFTTLETIEGVVHSAETIKSLNEKFNPKRTQASKK